MLLTLPGLEEGRRRLSVVLLRSNWVLSSVLTLFGLHSTSWDWKTSSMLLLSYCIPIWFPLGLMVDHVNFAYQLRRFHCAIK